MDRVRGEGSEVTHRAPQGDAVFWDVVEVIGLKRVPVGKNDGRAVCPLKVHLHGLVMETKPELVHLCKGG